MTKWLVDFCLCLNVMKYTVCTQHREALKQWEDAYKQLGGIVKKGGLSNTGAAEVDQGSGGDDLRSAIKSELQNFEENFVKMNEA